MLRKLAVCISGVLAGSMAWGQGHEVASSNAKSKAWVAPGTPGASIDGDILRAQVLLGSAGFSTGVIDGRDGPSFRSALRGFQMARSLAASGRLDQQTRAILFSDKRPSTVNIKLGPNDISYDYLYPFPAKASDQAKADGLKYRNMIEEAAERFHTTPETLIALNGPKALIGRGHILRVPNVLPAARNFDGVPDKYLELFQRLNVDSNQP